MLSNNKIKFYNENIRKPLELLGFNSIPRGETYNEFSKGRNYKYNALMHISVQVDFEKLLFKYRLSFPWYSNFSTIPIAYKILLLPKREIVVELSKENYQQELENIFSEIVDQLEKNKKEFDIMIREKLNEVDENSIAKLFTPINTPILLNYLDLEYTDYIKIIFSLRKRLKNYTEKITILFMHNMSKKGLRLSTSDLELLETIEYNSSIKFSQLEELKSIFIY